MRLARDEDSPLRDHVSSGGEYKGRAQECWLAPSALVAVFKPMFGPDKPWQSLPEDTIVKALKVYASELLTMWSRQWRDPKEFVLRSNSGLTALLICFTSNKKTRIHLPSYTHLSDISEFARGFSGFRWNRAQRDTDTVRQLVAALENHFVNLLEREQRQV